MAKLRRNHQAKGTAASTGSLARIGILGAIVAALAWGFNSYLGGGGGGEAEPEPDRIDYEGAEFFYPTGGEGELIEHAGFALSYLEDWEQAEWTAHILTRENLEKDWNKRSNNFRPDPFVQSRTAIDDDYRGSGYDRGHLVPSADLAWNKEWADESFMFSNISPQARQFNQGIWRELEETTRDWAKKFKRLYVITGPITTQDPKGTIGRRNRVAIPVAYFKVLLDLDDPERKGIGFLIPNQVSFDPLYEYAYPIDEIEEVSGLNFFSDLMPPELESKIEADGNIDLWPFNQRKYQKRLNDWNNVSN